MIDPDEFLNKEKEDEYASFKKMDMSYLCQHMGCGKFAGMTYRDEKNQLLIWKCPDGHENKAKAAFQ